VSQEILEDIEASPFVNQRFNAQRPGARPYTPPRQPTSAGVYVTKTEFQSAMDKISGDVKTLAGAHETLKKGVVTLGKDLKREIASLKRQNDSSMLFPLLLMPQPALPTYTTPTVWDPTANSGKGGATGEQLTDSSGNRLQFVTQLTPPTTDIMLPLILMMGMGGLGSDSSGKDGSSGGFGDNSAMMMLAVVLATRPH
jgi:hypothetical protein